MKIIKDKINWIKEELPDLYGNIPTADIVKIIEYVELEAESKVLHIADVRLSLLDIQEAAANALLLTRQSKGMKTNKITERELELAERAFINGAIWAKNKYEGNEA